MDRPCPIGAVTVLVAAFFVAGPVLAASQCAQRSSGVELLARKYGERPVGRGVTHPNGQLFELYVSPESGSWTALLSLPGGLACQVGEGSGWERIERLPAGPDT